MGREQLLLQHAAFLCWGKIYIICFSKARHCLFSEILEQNLPRYLHITVFLHKKNLFEANHVGTINCEYCYAMLYGLYDLFVCLTEGVSDYH